ncbi:cytochrome p450 [Rhypophila decipiens]
MASLTLQPLLSLLTSTPVITLLLIALLYTIDTLILSPPYPKNIPLINEPPSARRFSLKTRYRFYTDNVALHQEAWNSYLKLGKPVVLPTLGYSAEVVLPPGWMKWVHSLPEHVVSVAEAFVQFDKIFYSMGDEKYIRDQYQGLLVKRFDLEVMGGAIWDEMGDCFSRWVDGKEEDQDGWKEVDVAETVRGIVAQITARFTVGLDLCRNEEYLRLTCDISDAFVVTAAVGMAVPPILQPVACRLAALPLRVKTRRFLHMLEPVYKKRVEQLKSDAKPPPQDSSGQQQRDSNRRPYDHLQLMLEFAQRNRPDEFESINDMGRRLAIANFGGIHQTAIHLGVMVLDLLGSDAEFNTISSLRDEFKRVMYSDGDPDKWTKSKLASLVKADSLGRESMRLNQFGGRALFRKVVADGGLKGPGDHGHVVLPKGTMFSFLSKMPQTDEQTYPDALKLDPFRFSRMREAAAAAEGIEKGAAPPPVSFVSLSLDHLPFAHGKHACPGRFIVDFEMKMLFCYLLKNYDIEWPSEYEGRRPPNVYVAEACFPPKGARMRIRRREVPAF